MPIIDAEEFWFEHFGRHMPANGPDPLMATYPHREDGKPACRMSGPMAPATFLISSSRSVVRFVSRRPEELPAHIETGKAVTPGVGFDRWLAGVLMDPPPVPFLLCTIGAARADAQMWRITLDHEAIRLGGVAKMFGGNPSLTLSRSSFLRGVDWILDGGDPRDLGAWRASRRSFLAGQISRPELDRLRRKISTDEARLSSWPGPDNDYLIRLAGLAATAVLEAGSALEAAE